MSDAPVLLVHGFASSFDRNWREPGWVDLLSESGREVIGLDLLGHGNADKPHDPAAYDDLEGDVAKALPEGAGTVDAIGFSLGARLLLGVAASMPERFNRIVVGGIGNGVFLGGSSSEAIAQAVEGGVDGDSPAIARVFAQFAAGSGNDPKALAACMRRTSRALTPEEVGRIACPVLVVIGDRDFAAPADELVAALPDARLVTLPGVDHFATPKDFRFLDAALEFLGAVPA